MMKINKLNLKLQTRNYLFMLFALVSFEVLFIQDVSSNLILYYSCDTITTSTIKDDSGNGNDGTLMGSASVVNSIMGDGIKCIANGDYIDCADNITTGLYSFTYTTWVKLNSLSSNTRFFDWGNGVDGNNNYLAFVPSFNGDNSFMTLRYRASTGTGNNLTSTKKCPIGEWIHIALTYSWNGSSGTGTIYLNGEAVGSKSGLPYNPAASLGNTADNYFGRSRWGQDTNGFNGTFDEIRIYDTALTNSEINELIDASGYNKLLKEYNQLSLNNISSLTSNIELPTIGETYSDVEISWSSTQPGIIANDGTVTQPNYYDFNVTLTATLSLGSMVKTKTFVATVKAADSTTFNDDLLVRYDFSDVDGTTVTDVAEKHFEGSLKFSASVVTMGTPKTGIYNVLNLGTYGYFNMGTDIGEVVGNLNNYTISAYYRIDEDYTGISNNGNFLWTFSNSLNASYYQNGCLFGSLSDQSVLIGYNSELSGDQSVDLNRSALRGNWHNMTYTQNGNTGTLYIDGIRIASETITNKPSNTLILDGSLGTTYNWIGKACFAGQSFLKNTLVYDFRIYSRALTVTEIAKTELDVTNNIILLEAAYNANIDDSITAESSPLDIKNHEIPDLIEIIKSDQSSTKFSLSEFKKITFGESTYTIDLTNGAGSSYTYDNIKKMMFRSSTSNLPDIPSITTINLFPNPANSFISVITNNIDEPIQIYSTTGQLLITKRPISEKTTINTNQLEAGIYIIKSGSQVAKFTKQ